MEEDLFQIPNETSEDSSQEDLNPGNNNTRVEISDNTNNSDSGFFDTQAIESFFFWVFIGLLLIGVILLFGRSFITLMRWLIHNYKRVSNWQETAMIEIRVPKLTPDEGQKEFGVSKMKEHETISRGEAIFDVLSDIAKVTKITNTSRYLWFFGAERITFEIVNKNKEIFFWISSSYKYIDIIKQQVIATYPNANITDLNKEDISLFKDNQVSYGQELILENTDSLPFKTYMSMEFDPLNDLTNSLTSVKEDEMGAIQLVLTPVTDSWQKNPRKIASKIQQGFNPDTILNPKTSYFDWIPATFKYVWDLFFKKEKDENSAPEKVDRTSGLDISGKTQNIQLTPQQQEIIKKLEEKSSKNGFIFTLRVIAGANTEERAKTIVQNIIPSFQVFDISPFNRIKRWGEDTIVQFVKPPQDAILLNFLYRSHRFNADKILNSEEVNSIWHLPNFLTQTPNIKWLQSIKPAVPLEIPGPGPKNICLGKASSRGQTKQVYITEKDRFRHVYSLGGSGSGKSHLMTQVILQDIKLGNGLCVIDPHGETVDEVLLRYPKERKDDLIIFSPAFVDKPLGLNMLETDPLKPTQKTLVIDTLFQIWDKLYDLKKTGGPMFENYMKNSMRLVMSHPESGNTLMEISKVLSDEDFRSFKLAMCDEQEVVDFWEKEALKAGGEASLENMVPYITSKLAPFISNDFIRPMIGQAKSAINFREAMDNKKVILVKLEKGRIGETSAYLVGMIIVGNILLAGMGRNDGLKYNLDGSTTEILSDQRSPFFVYIDEMQNFLFDAIPKALEEIRKYKVGFYLAHQFIKQVIENGNERIKDSIMANCATKIIFRAGADDAEYLEKEFGPTLKKQDLQNPEKYTASTILLAGGQKTTPFNLMPPAELGPIDPDFRKELVQATKEKYGKDPESIEKEIRDRAKLLF